MPSARTTSPLETSEDTESSLWERTMPGSVALVISSASLKSTSGLHSSKSTSPFAAGAVEGSADGATGADSTTVLSASEVAGASAAGAVVAAAAAGAAAAAATTGAAAEGAAGA